MPSTTPSSSPTAPSSPSKKRTAKQNGVLSKRKGKVFERDITKTFTEAGVKARRGWWQSMGGALVPDVMVDGLWLELGHGKTMDPKVKLEQAIGYVRTRGLPVIPVAITKRDHMDPVVTLRAHDFSAMLHGESPYEDVLGFLVHLDLDAFILLYKSWVEVVPVHMFELIGSAESDSPQEGK